MKSCTFPPWKTGWTYGGAKKGASNDDGGAPLVFSDDSGAGASSGWVTYLPGLSGGRAQGTVLISSRKAKDSKVTA